MASSTIEVTDLGYKVGGYGRGRLGPEGNHHRRAGDAGADVDPEQVCGGQAAGRRPHHGLAAHDDSDRGAD